MSANGYRYTGSGERYRGVPARDLTQEDFDGLGPLEQRRVVESGVFEAVKATKTDAKKTDAKKEAE